MQEQQVFEYAVIRLVPKVEREEFLNVGVVLYCAKYKFLQMCYHVDAVKWSMMQKELDENEIIAYLEAFNKICIGGKPGGSIGMMDRAERFRWLTATRSTVMQTSKVHLGLCTDPANKLKQLFEQLVL
jgi:hypothetical protein